MTQALTPYQSHAASLLEILSETRQITSTEEYQELADSLRDIKTRRKFIAEEEDKVTRPLREGLNAARALFKNIDAQYLTSENKIKALLAAYDTERKEAERKALSAALETDNARALVTLAAQAAPVAQGVSMRTLYDFEVVDPNLVPDEFWMIDEKKIGALVRASKGTMVPPGVKVIETTSVAARSK